MINSIILFISSSSLLIYFISYFSGSFNSITSAISILCSFLIVYLYRKKFEKTKNKFIFSKLNLLVSLIILGYVVVVGYVISPLAVTQKVGQDTFLRYVGIGDYYKHSYVITSLKESGIPPHHPYFPDAKFSYYYGYYLLPAAISTLSPISANTILLAYIILTTIFCLVLIFKIISGLIRNQIIKLICFLAAIFGTSLDFLMVLFYGKDLVHIENWLQQVINGHAVENIYSSLIWTPQHLISATLCIYIVYLLYKKKINPYLLIGIFTYIFTSSIFIALTLFLWMILSIIIFPKSRKLLLISGIISALFVAPFFLSLTVGKGLIYFYRFDPIPLLPNPNLPQNVFLIIRSVLYFAVEHGLAFVIFLPVILFTKIPNSYKLALLVALYFPRILTLFYRSTGVNDLSLKVLQPVQLSVNILYFYLIDRYFANKKIKVLLVSLSIPFIIIGLCGNVFEVYHLWKNRKIVPYDDSQLLFSIRKLPEKFRLLALSKDEWVFMIPVQGERMILSPSLYDSYMYLPENANKNGKFSFEDLGNEIFIDKIFANSEEEILSKETNLLNMIPEYISSHNVDGVIVPEKDWVKKGKNIWNQIFIGMGVEHNQISPSFNLFSYQDLLSKLDGGTLKLNMAKLSNNKIVDHKVNLNQGAYFIFSCASEDGQDIKLEFDEYFTLYSEKLKYKHMCLGKTFFNTTSERLQVSGSSTVSSFWSIPIIY